MACTSFPAHSMACTSSVLPIGCQCKLCCPLSCPTHASRRLGRRGCYSRPWRHLHPRATRGSPTPPRPRSASPAIASERTPKPCSADSEGLQLLQHPYLSSRTSERIPETRTASWAALRRRPPRERADPQNVLCRWPGRCGCSSCPCLFTVRGGSPKSFHGPGRDMPAETWRPSRGG